jgi:hypothetical protein
MIVFGICAFFFFKRKTAYEMLRSLVGSEMCIETGIAGVVCCAACVIGVYGYGDLWMVCEGGGRHQDGRRKQNRHGYAEVSHPR